MYREREKDRDREMYNGLRLDARHPLVDPFDHGPMYIHTYIYIYILHTYTYMITLLSMYIYI